MALSLAGCLLQTFIRTSLFLILEFLEALCIVSTRVIF